MFATLTAGPGMILGFYGVHFLLNQQLTTDNETSLLEAQFASTKRNEGALPGLSRPSLQPTENQMCHFSSLREDEGSSLGSRRSQSRLIYCECEKRLRLFMSQT